MSSSSRTKWGAALLALALAGCGYHLQGAGGSSLPPHVRKIHIPIFTNKTLEQGIEVRLTDALRSVIINDGRVFLASGVSDADAILEGQILQYRLRAIAFTRSDRAQEFRLRMTVAVTLRDLQNDRLIFKQTVVSDREYRVSTDLSSNERSQSEATLKASEDFARELRGLLIEGF
ncbi:MAG: LptE family protein [Candidatus Tectomicrobia bacterium]|nr:LptE family protein [Candidatus Tectomicrobia bacterium]